MPKKTIRNNKLRDSKNKNKSRKIKSGGAAETSEELRIQQNNIALAALCERALPKNIGKKLYKTPDGGDSGGTKATYTNYNQIPAEILAEFPMTEEQIQNYSLGHVPFGNDCVINALQILGLIDTYIADLLRITAINTTGYTVEQITKLLERTSSYKHEFKQYNKWEAFETALNPLKNVGLAEREQTALFCGITRNNGTQHVFIINRNTNGRLEILDPQESEGNRRCTISFSPEFYGEECTKRIHDNISNWFVLFRSEEMLTPELWKTIGFVNL